MSDHRATIVAEYRNYVEKLSGPLTYLKEYGNSLLARGVIHTGPPPPPPVHELIATASHMRADLRGLIELVREMDAIGMLKRDE